MVDESSTELNNQPSHISLHLAKQLSRVKHHNNQRGSSTHSGRPISGQAQRLNSAFYSVQKDNIVISERANHLAANDAQ